ncbi:TlpA family protein disulfide reductase [Nocardioides oleivorans]|uniref:TlpA family protein disulfide reductase n=1 Tax=Nocardioides oleivorans TaxID=273676 RepID=A0A4Q2S2G8_9ACTN|nr:TlpA family protein disulfide reductase [Nocardioides oleivorans]
MTIRDWTVAGWLGTPRPDFAVGDLADRVVLAAAFQMLCPGCVETTIPQLRRAAATFPADQVAVVGLHTVFEHHEAMTPVALQAFLHEYRVTFPVAMDQPARRGQVPVTMERFAMQGTPTVMLYDRAGALRRRTFGHVPDLELGAQVAALVLEDGPTAAPPVAHDVRPSRAYACDETGCRV